MHQLKGRLDLSLPKNKERQTLTPALSRRRGGFTLAETLITLVIIGVIAAITVPSLMHKIENNQLQSAFKKTVSVTSQAIQKMKIDFGDTVYDIENDSCEQFMNAFKKYFSVICSSNCIDSSKYKNFAGLDDDSLRSYISKNATFIVADGMSYSFRKPIGSGGTENIYITVDINGPKKKPNRWGYDLFTFYVSPTQQALKPVEVGAPWSGYVCNRTSTSHNGGGCTKEAMYNSDYFKNL